MTDNPYAKTYTPRSRAQVYLHANPLFVPGTPPPRGYARGAARQDVLPLHARMDKAMGDRFDRNQARYVRAMYNRQVATEVDSLAAAAAARAAYEASDAFRNKIYRITKKRNVARQKVFDRLGAEAKYSGFGRYNLIKKHRRISKHRIVAHPKLRRKPVPLRNWSNKTLSKRIRSMQKGHRKFDLDLYRQKWYRHRAAMKTATNR